jgi:hypothetical protein
MSTQVEIKDLANHVMRVTDNRSGHRLEHVANEGL